MKKLILILWGSLAIAQSATPPYNIQIAPQPLPIVSNVFANYTGTVGQNTYFYWVIARYGVGNSAPSQATRVNGIGTGSVSIGWSAPAQPTGYTLAYDILRTSSAAFPGSCSNCLVSGNQTTLSVTDSLGALASYSSNTFNSNNPVNVTVDDINNSSLQIVGSSPFSPTSNNGGALIPSTTNLIKGNGSGNGADSGIAPSAVITTSSPCGGDLSGTEPNCTVAAVPTAAISAPQGNGTKVQLSTGTTTTNDCVKFDANGNTVDNGAACAVSQSAPVWTSKATLTFPAASGSGTDANITLAFTGSDTKLKTVINGGQIQNTVTSIGVVVPADLIITSDPTCATLAGNYSWDIETYSPSAGTLVGWVRIPSLTTGASVIPYVCIGNSTVATFQGHLNGSPFDTNTVLAYHFPDGTTLNSLDFSSQTNNGTLGGATGTPAATAGQIDGASVFVAANQQSVKTPFVNLGTVFTVEAWNKPTSGQAAVAGCSVIVGNSYPTGFYLAGGSFGYCWNVNNGSGIFAGSLTAGTYKHVAGTFDGTNRILYVNGASVGSNTSTVPTIGSYPIAVGVDQFTHDVPSSWDGSIDEVKISTVARSAGWIATEYANQLSPPAIGTFASIYDPPLTYTFTQVIQSLRTFRDFEFGTAGGKNIGTVSQLSNYFQPYGIAGSTVINQNWQIYQSPFNTTNWVFTGSSLDITATIPGGGGLFAGGINSGQIASNDVFQPGVTGSPVYAFETNMKIPSGLGAWPQNWFYLKSGTSDASEIDNPEFFIGCTTCNGATPASSANESFFQHGTYTTLYTLANGNGYYTPGTDFSAGYHKYQTLWTPDAVYKYLDGLLVYQAAFTWTDGPAQTLTSLAVGTDDAGLPGVKPTSLGEFPMVMSIDHITIWSQ